MYNRLKSIILRKKKEKDKREEKKKEIKERITDIFHP